MCAVQTTLFSFDYEVTESSKGPAWLTVSRDERRRLSRTDAEATVEYLNALPGGKGSWWRCLTIDHGRSYNRQWKGWDVEMWLQGGVGVRKMATYEGDVKDFVDPHPYDWHYSNGRLARPWKYEPLEGAAVDGDVLRLTTASGEYMAEIYPDSERGRYDVHPYRPTFDMEHFLIECIRKKVPRGMMSWTDNYVYGTPALRPFSRAMTEEEICARDPMGTVPGAIEPNGHFAKVCACADLMGIRLELSHDVPVLKNHAMYPNEETCRSCIRRGKGIRKGCEGKGNELFCDGYMWDRKTPAKTKKRKSKTPDIDEDADECIDDDNDCRTSDKMVRASSSLIEIQNLDFHQTIQ